MLLIYIVVAIFSGIASSHLAIGLFSHINWINEIMKDPIIITQGAWRIISIIIAIRIAFSQNAMIKSNKADSGDELTACFTIPLYTFFVTLFLIFIATILHKIFIFIGSTIIVIAIVIVVIVLLASGEL